MPIWPSPLGCGSDEDGPEVEQSPDGETIDSDLELKLHIMGSKMLWTETNP